MKHSRKSGLLLLAVLVLLLGSCAQSAPSQQPTTEAPARSKPIPVLVDTDMGADDVIAILFLLARQDVEVKTITVAATGLAHCDAGVAHAIHLVELTGRSGIPIACGRQEPPTSDRAFPPDFRAQADAFYGMNVEPKSVPAGIDAAGLVQSTLTAHPEGINLLSLGPPTNLAEALIAMPSLAESIDRLVIMGGAVNVPGNVFSAGVGGGARAAEWNFYVDPGGANLVLQSGAPVTLVPLDATNDVPITPQFRTALRQNAESPAAQYVLELFEHNPGMIAGGFYFWDPLAASVLVSEEHLDLETMRLRVVESGDQGGRVIRSDDGARLMVATGADQEQFERLLLAGLSAGTFVEGESESELLQLGSEDILWRIRIE